ncbi:MAG: hypothetical protein JWM21_1825 [Acidobacteria bacterium]|nr:hypothetical protein [Acidobacteriota bacterium]
MMADQFTAEETQMFTHLEIDPTDIGLKNLISVQRKLNGSLCKALWATLDALEIQASGKSATKAIADAKALTLKVAEEPPGCDPRNPIPGGKG